MTILDEILTGIVTALLVALAVLLIMNANLRADLAVARANAMTLGSVNADLKFQTDKQNQTLALLKTESDARALAAQKAVKAAATQAKRYTVEAAAIGQPDSGSDDCAGAKQILWEYLKDRK